MARDRGAGAYSRTGTARAGVSGSMMPSLWHLTFKPVGEVASALTQPSPGVPGEGTRGPPSLFCFTRPQAHNRHRIKRKILHQLPQGARVDRVQCLHVLLQRAVFTVK